jgi:hypothetical protein
MLKESKVEGVAVEVKRWSVGRKKEVALRLLRNEPVNDLSRAVSINKFEQWRDRALAGRCSVAASSRTLKKFVPPWRSSMNATIAVGVSKKRGSSHPLTSARLMQSARPPELQNRVHRQSELVPR